MPTILIIAINAILIENFVLVKFLLSLIHI